MKSIRFCITSLALIAFAHPAWAADGFMEKLDDYLAISAFHGNVRARVSGLLDIEGYYVTQPAPGLIETDHNFLFNPRLTVFLDVQASKYVYAFAQARVDRGFDPQDGGGEVRLDEYAVRVSPFGDARFSVQVGKFATVIGNWVERHHSWENPFITGPLPYENVTAISDRKAPSSPAEFLGKPPKPYVETSGEDDEEEYSTPPPESGTYSEKYERNPIIWGPSYTSGLSFSGQIGKFDYAAEVKNASLSSRPESWDATQNGFQHPSFSSRIGFRPNEMWNFGLSASEGPYLRPEAAEYLPEGRGIGDYREILLGQDLSFAWHHLQIWAECYETRFQVPTVGNADTLAYYIEAKYKFATQLFGALRWNQQFFGTVPDGEGGAASWGDNLWTIDMALGYRFTPNTQVKLQYSLCHADTEGFGHSVAAQFTVRF
jgi:hypothetical protein